ncbi:MAG: hypothetical protein ACR2L8_16125 [Solirubrobacteraceae bacterium]
MTHVLVLANRTAATPTLLAAVRDRAERGAATFHLVVPASPHGLNRIVDPEVSGLPSKARAMGVPVLHLEADAMAPAAVA